MIKFANFNGSIAARPSHVNICADLDLHQCRFYDTRVRDIENRMIAHCIVNIQAYVINVCFMPDHQQCIILRQETLIC